MISSTAPVVREATLEEAANWDTIVAAFENNTVLRRSAWLRTIEAFSVSQPLLLVIEKDGEVVACLPGFVVRKALLRIFGSPLIGCSARRLAELRTRT